MKNKVQLIGNAGIAPEVKTLESGKQVARLTLAVNETYKSKEGEKVKETTWFNLIGWGKTAEIMQKIVSKGSELAVEGKLQTRVYTHHNGTKVVLTEVLVQEITLLSKKHTQKMAA
jgi:single-strand DNA-binding protein